MPVAELPTPNGLPVLPKRAITHQEAIDAVYQWFVTEARPRCASKHGCRYRRRQLANAKNAGPACAVGLLMDEADFESLPIYDRDAGVDEWYTQKDPHHLRVLSREFLCDLQQAHDFADPLHTHVSIGRRLSEIATNFSLLDPARPDRRPIDWLDPTTWDRNNQEAA